MTEGSNECAEEDNRKVYGFAHGTALLNILMRGREVWFGKSSLTELGNRTVS